MNVPGEIKAGIFHDAIGSYTLVGVLAVPVRGVQLPKHVLLAARKAQQGVLTHWGDSLPNPIPDMAADDVALRGTLSFGGIPHAVLIPWEAVIAIVVEGAFNATFNVDPGLLELPLDEPIKLPRGGFKPRVIDGGKDDE